MRDHTYERANRNQDRSDWEAEHAADLAQEHGLLARESAAAASRPLAASLLQDEPRPGVDGRCFGHDDDPDTWTDDPTAGRFRWPS